MALPRRQAARYGNVTAGISIMSTPASVERFDVSEFLQREAQEHRAAVEATMQDLPQPFAQTLDIWERAIRRGGKLLLFGNGGSAADAQHIAAELVIRYKSNRSAIAAIALTTDSSTLTACANDFGYESIFSRQIEALATTGDVAVGISTSGSSPNVLAGLREARKRKVTTTGLTGGDGGSMRDLCDALVIVPSRTTARIQEGHIMIGHMLCKALEIRLDLV
jgi:D-sedoheptulose 7-phosphate isomerase